MSAILGRMAAYSGKMITWDEAINSEIKLTPDGESWDSPAPVSPTPEGAYAIPKPGITRTV